MRCGLQPALSLAFNVLPARIPLQSPSYKPRVPVGYLVHTPTSHVLPGINQLGALSQRARACLRISSLGSNRRQSPCLVAGLPDRLRPASLQTTKETALGALSSGRTTVHLLIPVALGQMIHPVFVCARCSARESCLIGLAVSRAPSGGGAFARDYVAAGDQSGTAAYLTAVSNQVSRAREMLVTRRTC